jgi:predicted small lipoprotein YifL
MARSAPDKLRRSESIMPRHLAFLLLIALAGCGYKAPLYRPDATPKRVPPVVTPEPVPDRPQPAEAVPPPR